MKKRKPIQMGEYVTLAGCRGWFVCRIPNSYTIIEIYGDDMRGFSNYTKTTLEKSLNVTFPKDYVPMDTNRYSYEYPPMRRVIPKTFRAPSSDYKVTKTRRDKSVKVGRVWITQVQKKPRRASVNK